LSNLSLNDPLNKSVRQTLIISLHGDIPAKPRDSDTDDNDADYWWHSNDRHQNYHCISYHITCSVNII